MSVNKKNVIGLTGTIASGKTTLAELYESLGASIVDADILSRKVLSSDKATLKALKDNFPNAFSGSVLDRALLKAEVFNDDNKLKTLNDIMFPAIKKLAIEKINNLDSDNILLVAPLLYESKFNELVDKVICVYCDNDTAINRIIKRDNIDIDLAKKIIASQMPYEEKIKLADFTIDTGIQIDEWKKSAIEIFGKVKV